MELHLEHRGTQHIPAYLMHHCDKATRTLGNFDPEKVFLEDVGTMGTA